MWVEIDSFDPRALALIRRSIATPLASCESLFGRRQFKDFLENYSMDVGIVDLPWNGILESMKIAAMAEAYEVNCAPHNFYGHMSTLMSAHFCAAIRTSASWRSTSTMYLGRMISSPSRRASRMGT